jgi:hypothetical protein
MILALRDPSPADVATTGQGGGLRPEHRASGLHQYDQSPQALRSAYSHEQLVQRSCSIP